MVYNRGTMKKLTIAFLAAASLMSFGCKKKGGAGEAMAKMSEFKDKMCACKDKKCADDVQDQMNKWSAENAKSAGDKAEKPDDKAMKEMQDVGTKYGECMAKAMGGGDAAKPADPKPADPKPAEPAGTKAACVDGAYKDPANTYCVKVPEGYTPPKETQKLDGKAEDQFTSADGRNFTITVWTDPAMTFDSAKTRMQTEGNGYKIVDKGEFEGGGFYVNGHNDAEKETGIGSVIKSGTKVIVCDALTNDDHPFKPADACKTLRAM
jgi:hypothetical protein